MGAAWLKLARHHDVAVGEGRYDWINLGIIGERVHLDVPAQPEIARGEEPGVDMLKTLLPALPHERGPTAVEHGQMWILLVAGGGAAFVWQGGQQGFQHIYARFLSPGNLWLGGDIQVNTFADNAPVIQS